DAARDVVVDVPSVRTWSFDRVRSRDAQRVRLDGAAPWSTTDVQPSVPGVVHRYTAPDARLDLSPGLHRVRLGGRRGGVVASRVQRPLRGRGDAVDSHGVSDAPVHIPPDATRPPPRVLPLPAPPRPSPVPLR